MKMRTLLLGCSPVATVLFCTPAALHARPKIGLVPEGGGAPGFAHIGVIQYLEEHHIPVNMVAGTSMGGLVGGLYAIGDSPGAIREFTDDIDWDSVLGGTTKFQDLSFRRKESKQAFAIGEILFVELRHARDQGW